MSVSRETGLLAVITTADAFLTLWLILHGRATEANPVLRFYLLQGGIVCFLGAKFLLSLGPLYVLEVLRARRPRFVRAVLRFGIAAYLLAYSVGVWNVNAPG